MISISMKVWSKHYLYVLGALVVTASAIFGWQYAAAQTELSAVGTTISPPSVELTADPGQTLEHKIRVSNRTEGTLSYAVSSVDFRVEGQEGSVAIEAENKEAVNTLAGWIRPNITQFTLAADKSTEVIISIRVPKNAPPGGHFASVLFQPLNDAELKGPGAKVIPRVGALVLLKVSGEVVERGHVTKLQPKSFRGEWHELTGTDGKTKIFSAQNEDLKSEKPKRYFSKGPVAFDMVTLNEGNVHFKPAGTLTIKNIFGRSIEKIAIEPKNVFPGGERRVTIIWPRKSLWGVFYKAELTAIFGTQNQTLTKSTYFFAFPLWALLTILATLVVLIFARKRLKKVIRILVRGE